MTGPTPQAIAEAAKILREAVQDKSYQSLPLGQDVAGYLRAKRKRLTPGSSVAYEGTLHKLVLDFGHLTVEDFEPPDGAMMLERFLDDRWGRYTPGTYNVRRAHVSEFFKFWRKLGRLQGDPMLLVEPAKMRDVERTVYSDEQRTAILSSAIEQRDRVALRLLLDYGLRKGACRGIRFKDFDHQRREIMIFTKGQKIRSLPLPDPKLWEELEWLMLDMEMQPHNWLMYLVKQIPRAGTRRYKAVQMSSTAMHRWWYRHLALAGVVEPGVTRGEKIHKARHSAGQHILDMTGDIKLTQQVLGHKSIQTTADIYTNYENSAIAERLSSIVRP